MKKIEYRTQLRDRLREFLQKKFGAKHGNQAQLARECGFGQDDLSNWLRSGSMPGWALLKIFETYPDAKDFFIEGKEPSPAPAPDPLVERFARLVKKPFYRVHWDRQVAMGEGHELSEAVAEERELTPEEMEVLEAIMEEAPPGASGPELEKYGRYMAKIIVKSRQEAEHGTPIRAGILDAVDVTPKKRPLRLRKAKTQHKGRG